MVSEESEQGVHLELWKDKQNKNEETAPRYISISEVNQIWSLIKEKSQIRSGMVGALLPDFLAVGLPLMLIKVNNPHTNTANGN